MYYVFAMIGTLALCIYILLAGSEWIKFIFKRIDYNSVSAQVIIFGGLVVIVFLPAIVAELIGAII